MIDDQASWQKVYDFWADYKGLETFNVSGAVTDSAGAPVSYPVVIVYRGNSLHGWVMGDQTGHYSDRPTERERGPGLQPARREGGHGPRNRSANFTSASVPAGGVNLQTGSYKVPVTFNFQDQNGDPVWGRVSVGANPLITSPDRTSSSPTTATTARWRRAK